MTQRSILCIGAATLGLVLVILGPLAFNGYTAGQVLLAGIVLLVLAFLFGVAFPYLDRRRQQGG